MSASPLTTSRRDLLKAAAGAGALLVFARPQAASATARFVGEIGPFVRIDADGAVTIGCHVGEMGQGVSTALPMLIAEELDVPFERVSIQAMPLHLARNARGQARSHLGAGQSTAGGSNSVRVGFMPLRQAGARARLMILEAAAERWRLPVGELKTEDGVVRHAASGAAATYGELAGEAAKRPEPIGEIVLKTPDRFSVIGKPQRHLDADRIVRGEALFGIDAEMPGMLHAVVARCPYLGGKVATLDEAHALKLAGVVAIVPIPVADAPAPPLAPQSTPLAAGVAVVAMSFWEALQASDALKITWSRGAGAAADESSARAYADTWAKMESTPGDVVRKDGDFANLRSLKTVSARYEAAMVAHACMEPPNAIVSVDPDGKRACAILATQAPDVAAATIATVTGIDPLQIDVTLARMGGGFGRKFDQDMVAEAAIIANAVRRPVKLVWTRDDDLQHDLYRPGACHILDAAVAPGGRILGWRHRLATHSRLAGAAGDLAPRLTEYYPDGFPAGHVPNMEVEYHLLPSAAPRGAWRGPGHVVNAFAIECFLDEIAVASNRDPVELRLDMIGTGGAHSYMYLPQMPRRTFDTARYAAVIRRAAEASGWGEPMPKGRGRGFAAHFTFESYVAEVVEVSVEGGRLRIDRVTAAVDAGLIINPNGARAQIEGSINDGLSAALGQAITVRDGQVEQRNFSDYEMLRMDGAARRIDVSFIESPEPPNGLGEPGVPPLAPALANAIFAATGVRLRRTPMLPDLQAALAAV
ncbi:MAG: xanthine dehydrogenase family protein molybdopterin-binding subunit [Phenylobacterium sp.]|uniref:xanthine dehydrogenase family protein molybdopterin-binding subunit n=1 Tax=Phenylobacterium sp. TaxID=1871053 RepID=UPI0025E1523A|nr:molybdopterin cofactor-binding domain-containing protein [Phenylobacterium sp.]MBA4010449.1 xanthine dehydrogenase family protein molybdopterin-binding subunit [Phenylobacterium sp.]